MNVPFVVSTWGILCILFVIFIGPLILDENKETPPSTHQEVPYTLEDGTPCTILYLGLGGQMGITCNYNKEGN